MVIEKRKIIRLSLLLVAIITPVLVILFYVMLSLGGQVDRDRMRTFYSNDNNYLHYKATFLEKGYKYNNYKGEIRINNIVLLKEDGSSETIRIYPSWLSVYAPNNNEFWKTFDLEEEKEFDFYGSLVDISGKGLEKGVIIQITQNNEEIINYNDGKKALLEWVENYK